MPQYDGGRLHAYLRQTQCPLTQSTRAERFTMACDIAAFLQRIHQENIIHGNLKEEDIFLTKDEQGLRCVIGGLGFSVKNQERFQRRVSLSIHFAPEMHAFEPEGLIATPALDMWSFGIVLMKLFYQETFKEILRKNEGGHPLTRKMRDKALSQIQKEMISFLEKEASSLNTLILELLSLDPQVRPTAGDVLARLTAEKV